VVIGLAIEVIVNPSGSCASGTASPKSKNPLAKLWSGRCTIYEYQNVTDPQTFQTTLNEVAVLVDEPCRLSYNREHATNIANGAAIVSQSITLFIRPDLVIKPGSVIEITQHGVTEKYKGSGQPAVYCNHQEIVLELYENNV
jgi:hypothetical protein